MIHTIGFDFRHQDTRKAADAAHLFHVAFKAPHQIVPELFWYLHCLCGDRELPREAGALELRSRTRRSTSSTFIWAVDLASMLGPQPGLKCHSEGALPEDSPNDLINLDQVQALQISTPRHQMLPLSVSELASPGGFEVRSSRAPVVVADRGQVAILLFKSG